VLLIPLSIIIGHLRFRSKSVWPAALAHGTHNTLWSVFGHFATTSSLLFYMSGELGVFTLAGYSIAAIFVLRWHGQKENKPKENT
jgi:hypothetical protein